MDKKKGICIHGRVFFREGEFIPDEGMKKIDQIKQRLKLLYERGAKEMPYFFFDPTDNSYWEYIEQENYETTLKQVSREYIEKNHPTVDCDRTLD